MILTKAIQIFVIFRLQLLLEVKVFCQSLLTAKNFIADFKSIRVDVNWVMFLALELIIPLVVILLSNFAIFSHIKLFGMTSVMIDMC